MSTQYYIDNIPLTIADYCKYLGAVLRFNQSILIEEKVTKANPTLTMIRRNLKNVSKPDHNFD